MEVETREDWCHVAGAWLPGCPGGPLRFCMEHSLSVSQLAAYTGRQMNAFFPDENPVSASALEALLPAVLRWLETWFSGLLAPRFWRGTSS